MTAAWPSASPTLAVIVIHTALFTRHSSGEVVRAILGVARFNGIMAVLVLAGGIVGGTAQYVLWAWPAWSG